VPLLAPALIAGWLLAFTLSIDDLVIASFVSGPGASTLPMVIFSKVRLGLSPEINALADAADHGGAHRRDGGTDAHRAAQYRHGEPDRRRIQNAIDVVRPRPRPRVRTRNFQRRLPKHPSERCRPSGRALNIRG
jgi:hypothetical protein